MERGEGQSGNSVPQSSTWEDVSGLRWVKVRSGSFASQNVPRRKSIFILSTFLKVCLMRRVKEKKQQEDIGREVELQSVTLATRET